MSTPISAWPPLETGGTALSVTMDVPKTLYAADIGVCMFFAVHLALSLALDGWPYVLLHGLRYVCVPGLFVWTTHRARRHLPELAAFIKENLLD